MAFSQTSTSSVPESPIAVQIAFTLFAICVAQVAFLGATFFQGLWLQGADFVNVWAAGRLVLEGRPEAAYDWTLHKAAEQAAIGPSFTDYYPWFYPPPFLFAAAPLALFPYAPAFLGWMLLTLPAYAIAIRSIIGHRVGLLLACAFPAVLMNAVSGQNGYLTAALLGGALHQMERRPALAVCSDCSATSRISAYCFPSSWPSPAGGEHSPQQR